MRSPIARTYLSLAAFYAADPRRRHSRERDVGLWWRSRGGPTYRAAWVQDTEEIYLVQHGLTGKGAGRVHLLGETAGFAELEARLDGWKDVVGTRGSFEWLLAHAVPSAASAPRASRPRGDRPASPSRARSGRAA